MNALIILFYLFFLSDSTVTPEPKHISKDIEKVNFQQPKNPYYSRTDTTALNVKDETWKKILSPEVYHVAREKGTERAFTGKYWNATGIGTYYCAVCGNNLFRSDAKFASDCGWPSFFKANAKQVSFTKKIILITWNGSKYCAAVVAHIWATYSMMVPSQQANVFA